MTTSRVGEVMQACRKRYFLLAAKASCVGVGAYLLDLLYLP